MEIAIAEIVRKNEKTPEDENSMHFPKYEEILEVVQPFMINAVSDSKQITKKYTCKHYNIDTGAMENREFAVDGLSVTPTTETSLLILSDQIKESFYGIEINGTFNAIRNHMCNNNDADLIVGRASELICDSIQCIISDRKLGYEDRIWKYMWLTLAGRKVNQNQKYKLSPFCHGHWRGNLFERGMLKTSQDYMRKKSKLEYITDSKFCRNHILRNLSVGWHQGATNKSNHFPFRFTPYL